jgi:hypothetical protein
MPNAKSWFGMLACSLPKSREDRVEEHGDADYESHCDAGHRQANGHSI